MRRGIGAGHGNRLRVTLTLVVLYLAFAGAATAVELQLVPAAKWGWTVTVLSSDVASGVGGDVAPVYTSGAAAQVLAVTGTSGPEDAWRVVAKRSSFAWPENVCVSIRVTSTGTGDGTCEAPAGFQLLDATYAEIIRGEGDRYDIRIQLRLGGISVATVGAGTYSAQIVYTVTQGD